MAFVESACSQLGWGIDERSGSNGIILYFRDSVCVGGVRKVHITCGDADEFGIMNSYSNAQLHPRQVTTEVLAHLLRRNSESLAAWQMMVSDNKMIGFGVATALLLQGITPGCLKALCETIVQEVHDFDVKLREADLL